MPTKDITPRGSEMKSPQEVCGVDPPVIGLYNITTRQGAPVGGGGLSSTLHQPNTETTSPARTRNAGKLLSFLWREEPGTYLPLNSKSKNEAKLVRKKIQIKVVDLTQERQECDFHRASNYLGRNADRPSSEFRGRYL